jgi:hypothetical protein
MRSQATPVVFAAIGWLGVVTSKLAADEAIA